MLDKRISRTITIIIGIVIALYGLYVTWAGKLKHTDADAPTPADRVSTQIAGLGVFFLGIVFVPTVGFIVNTMGL
jgi:uncharacterized membrane protein